MKSALVTFLQTSELSSGTCLRLLTQLFGPNTTTRLSVKKHVDLVKVLSGRITQEAEVRQYFALMRAMFESPQADEVFGEVVHQEDRKVERGADDEEEEDDPVRQDEKQK